MTPKKFRASKEPWTFFCGLDPVTGERNYEYLEGWDWSGYIEGIKKDFPQRFHYSVRNKAANRLFWEAHGVTGLEAIEK